MSQDDSKVTEITAAPKPRRKNKPHAFELPLALTPKDWKSHLIQHDIVCHIADLAGRGSLAETYPIFQQYKTMRLSFLETEAIFRVAPNLEVELVSLADFRFAMSAFYRELFPVRHMGQPMSIGAQNATTELLLKYLDRFQPSDIRPFTFPSEARQRAFTWKAIDFDLIPWRLINEQSNALVLEDDAPPPLPVNSWENVTRLLEEQCPAWAGIVRRAGNSRAFLAFLGSLLDREGHSPHFLYMYGGGGDSKGAVMNALARIFGEKLTLVSNLPGKKSGDGGRFFSANLEGKRLLLAPDAEFDTDLFSGLFKSITSGDPLQVEPKGRQTRNAPNNVKAIVFSNHRPVIPDKPFARRRMILVPMKPIEGEHRPRYEEELLAERQEFFSICWAVYLLEPNKVQLQQDREVYSDNFEIMNDGGIALLEKYFEFTPPETLARLRAEGTPCAQLPLVAAADFEEFCRDRLRSKPVGYWRDLIARRFAVNREAQPVYFPKAKKHVRCLLGIQPLFPVMSQSAIPKNP